jgi:pilus assembly protein CpaC
MVRFGLHFPGIDNRLAVDTPLTVNLQVRVVEVQRTVTRQLGINWNVLVHDSGGFITGLSVVNRLIDATNLPDHFAIGYNGANGSVNAIVDALAQDQLAVILAEPNLTAQSGETASFLAGGEYPIPIAQQSNTISVEYKQYGVSLAFIPTVLSANRISLKVRPEVSELTNQGSVDISNGSQTLHIPALTVRRADTTVELASGQSFTIAGLLSDNSTQNARGLPSLGELPVIGALFRSTAFQRGQTELVIVVTPYLVRGVRDPTALVTPTRDMVLSNDLDRIVYNRQLARGTAQPTVTHISLDTGFIAP